MEAPTAFVVDLEPTKLQDRVWTVESQDWRVVGQASDVSSAHAVRATGPQVLVVYLSARPEAARDWAVRAKALAQDVPFAVLFVDGSDVARAAALRFLPAAVHTTSGHLPEGLKQARKQALRIAKAERQDA